jgi:hypothetical protein
MEKGSKRMQMDVHQIAMPHTSPWAEKHFHGDYGHNRQDTNLRWSGRLRHGTNQNPLDLNGIVP